MLIQKSVKRREVFSIRGLQFESFVNSEECKTVFNAFTTIKGFESFVNSEECKTLDSFSLTRFEFESFVNSEECKTL